MPDQMQAQVTLCQYFETLFRPRCIGTVEVILKFRYYLPITIFEVTNLFVTLLKLWVCKDSQYDYSTKIIYVRTDFLFRRSFQVQSNIFCSIKLFSGFLNFIDTNSKPTHTEALFGYNYSVGRPYFIRNLVLDVDCTPSNCYQSLCATIYHINFFTFHCNSLLEGAISF